MRELLSWLRRTALPGEREPPVDDAVATELAGRAESETVTADVLANRENRTHRPLVEYLAEDEQPEFVFRGSGLLIEDSEGSVTREHPTRELQVVITGRRLLFVVGGRISDDLWEVPLEDVVGAYVDEGSLRRHVIVEADREGDPMTFFADVTLESNEEAVPAGIEYVRESDPSPAD